MKASEAIGRLFDYAVEHADGFTYRDVEADLGWPRSYFTKIHRKLRLLLGNDDEIVLVCDPQGRREPWRYRLVGGSKIEDAVVWQGNRIRDSAARIVTQCAATAAQVRATDGRTNDGRRARIMHRGLTRIQEDLAELDHGGPPLF